MPEPKDTNELLDAVAKVLLRCIVFGFLLLLLWAAVHLLARSLMYRLAGNVLGLTPHDIDVIQFAGIVFTKVCVLLFFVFPYLAIQLVLRKRKA
jgi:hypothetical protein